MIEIARLQQIGGTLLGCVGDQNHDFGYHLCDPQNPDDYSTWGKLNVPVGDFACAFDPGMDWPRSREWLAWLITEIREDRIAGIAEVIGSYDGQDVRYWSDDSGWQQNGVEYSGTGHDTWTHVAVYRSTAREDHGILKGWTDNGFAPSGDDDMPQGIGPIQLPTEPNKHESYPIWPVNEGEAGFGKGWLSVWGDFFGGKAAIRLYLGNGKGGFTKVSDKLIIESGKTFGMELPKGTRGLSITRVQVDKDDACTSSLGFVVEYGKRL